MTERDEPHAVPPPAALAADEPLLNRAAWMRILPFGTYIFFIILADMLELGPSAPELHQQIGAIIPERADWLFTYGSLAEEIARGARDAGLEDDRIFSAVNHDELIEHLLGLLESGDRVLIKGSRGMRMEKVTAALRASLQKQAANGN